MARVKTYDWREVWFENVKSLLRDHVAQHMSV